MTRETHSICVMSGERERDRERERERERDCKREWAFERNGPWSDASDSFMEVLHSLQNAH